MQANYPSSDNNTVLHVQRISCKDVKCFNFFQKPSFYAVAALSTSTHLHQKQKTPADPVGGSNPEWKHTFRFHLPDDRRDVFLQFQLFAETAVFSDRVSGRVFVPLDDLFAGSPSDSFQTVMYQIQFPDGRPNGVLSFSFKAISSSPPQWLPDTGSPPPTTQVTTPEYPPTNILYPAVDKYEQAHTIYPSPISPPNYGASLPGSPPIYPPPISPPIYPPPPSTYYPPPDAVSGYPAPAPELAYLDRYDHGTLFVPHDNRYDHGTLFVPHDNRSLYPPVW